eukprot:gene5221-5752_t
MGLKKAWRNGAMRRGWNGITISRDTIHIDGVKLGLTLLSSLKDMLLVVNMVRAGKQSDDSNVVVTYQNPLDNVGDLAHHFFTRCLKAKVVSYVVTKKTVFKWQEGFWKIMKKVFDEYYKQQYIDSGIIPDGKLQHLISDAATMQIIRWTKGGFGMAAHNYDGDMLTDEIAQAYPLVSLLLTSLEFEASHGTVADLWHAHLRGEETSMNPLGLTFGAMNHSAGLADALHNTFRYGEGTRDMAGPEGFSTEKFVDKVAWRLGRYMAALYDENYTLDKPVVPARFFRRNYNVNKKALQNLFDECLSKKTPLPIGGGGASAVVIERLN